ncbi:type II CRISPR-associated endonuclease Cas1 [Lactobacillaceae bacterium L1_55_11]|nr:type II CRISPR-associated endonuclease Cas1 [Lactobacillaceae bacterium L1_55_11]
MAWRTVLVNSHAKINYSMNDINVQTSEGSERIPVDDIRVLILGNTRTVITAYALYELNRRHVKIVTCDPQGMPIGEFVGYHENVHQNDKLKKQINWGASRKEQLWQSIVRVKILNQHMALPKDVTKNYQNLKNLAEQVVAGDADNREAQAARLYFPRMFGKDFVRSDELNPINGHLNYGYAILLGAVSREIVSLGYLTQLGVHHQNWENYLNLASDLMEPFRPFVDRIVRQQQSEELTLENKLNLVGVLNEMIVFNHQEIELAQAVQKLVNQSLRFLSAEAEGLPEMSFVK